MVTVDSLKGMIEVCKRDIDRLRERLSLCENDLMGLYVDLFYAENGMDKGQHFMLDGKEYIEICVDRWGYIMGKHITKSGQVSLRKTSISRSDYHKIQPLPIGRK